MLLNRMEDQIRFVDSLFEKHLEQFGTISRPRNIMKEDKIPAETHSILRNSGIASRIAAAEKAEHDPVKIAQNRKEYEERINSLTKVLEDNAIQES